MAEVKDWMWLIMTAKGDFLITVAGEWTEEEAAQKVKYVFDVFLKLTIIGMVPRKRSTGPQERQGTIYEQPEPKDALGFNFLGGKKLWEVCGRGAEYQAELVLVKGQMKREKQEGLHRDRPEE
ncbi:hypothetical protein LCGC14_2326830 [marine sediment metagenome]|uniref:Uncharacterized protein n=1 Tax=marine sediment metagenome TaxID=412755 RepID=A0A0F9FB71_9ZZZZ